VKVFRLLAANQAMDNRPRFSGPIIVALRELSAKPDASAQQASKG